MKYGTNEIERRAIEMSTIEMKFGNHMVDFSFKVGTTLI